MEYVFEGRRVPLRMGNRRGMAGAMGVRYAPAGATYYAGGAVYAAAGALPSAAPNFNSATPRSAWWVQGPVGGATVNAMTGHEFVRAFQSALGVSSDGNWGPATTTAFKNYLVSRGVTGTVLSDVIRNLDQLLAGQTSVISGSTLLLAIWYTYYRNAIDLARMLGGTSEVRLGTNAMLPSVRPPPYRAAPPRPSRAEGRVTWSEGQQPPPSVGGTPTPPPSPPRPPAPTPGTPGTTPPGPGPGPGPISPINPGQLAGNVGGGVMGWWRRQTTGTKVAIGVGAAAVTALGVWAVTAEDGSKKKLPPPPPPRVYRPTVRVQFDQARRTR